MLIPPTGRHAGQPIWSCSTYPTCRGMIAVADDPPNVEARPSFGAQAPRIGRAWLLAAGIGLIAVLVVYLLAPALAGPR